GSPRLLLCGGGGRSRRVRHAWANAWRANGSALSLVVTRTGEPPILREEMAEGAADWELRRIVPYQKQYLKSGLRIDEPRYGVAIEDSEEPAKSCRRACVSTGLTR